MLCQGVSQCGHATAQPQPQPQPRWKQPHLGLLAALTETLAIEGQDVFLEPREPHCENFVFETRLGLQTGSKGAVAGNGEILRR